MEFTRDGVFRAVYGAMHRSLEEYRPPAGVVLSAEDRQQRTDQAAAEAAKSFAVAHQTVAKKELLRKMQELRCGRCRHPRCTAATSKPLAWPLCATKIES